MENQILKASCPWEGCADWRNFNHISINLDINHLCPGGILPPRGYFPLGMHPQPSCVTFRQMIPKKLWCRNSWSILHSTCEQFSKRPHHIILNVWELKGIKSWLKYSFESISNKVLSMSLVILKTVQFIVAWYEKN